MKRLSILFISLLFSIFAMSQPFNTIANGESGLSVRTNLNNLINYVNDLGWKVQFSSDKEGWHDSYAVGDYYIRFSTDYGDTYTNPVLIFDGQTVIDSLNMNNNGIINLQPGINVNDAVTLGQMMDSLSLVASSHNNLSDLQLANNAVTYGHISDQSQTLYGEKSFMTSPLIPPPDPGDSTLRAANTLFVLREIANNTFLYTDEEAQDAVGGILDNGTIGDIIFTYDDGTPKISGIVKDLKIAYKINLPSAGSVGGRVSGAVEGTDYPTGWVLAAGTNGADLSITHNLDRLTAYVSVWSIDGTEYTQLLGNAAYSGIKASTNSILLEGFATVITDVSIHIVLVQ